MAEPRWRPTLGARPDGDRTHFRVWAPGHDAIELVVESPGQGSGRTALVREADDYFAASVSGVMAGTRYRYTVDGAGPFPDPVSRAQPDGVHGPSLVVDPAAFRWSDAGWTGVPAAAMVLYELHVGTFTTAGTFQGVVERLPYLRDLGVTAIELMPVADFPGTRNWGYDGVALFAPARCYGAPDDLRALVDAAHGVGLAVVLDVVYNHAGPDGAYLFSFSPWYFTDRHATPWGKSVNLDGPHAAHVRRFFTENALHWIHEYHIDGLRFDATHAMRDDSPNHFLAELSERVQASAPGRPVTLIAEDHRNLASMVSPRAAGGWGLDGVWADDFHHQMRRALAGDDDGYFADFSGSLADLATTVAQGWFFTGQHSRYLGEARGTDPAGLPPRSFTVCLQNHDQIGNRALGERLHHQIAPAAFRAATVLLLTLPQTPLLFMGQEWAASAPFLYFTDHQQELGRLVTQGRRQEFGRFAAFASEAGQARIPDPQDRATFDASVLNWLEQAQEPHAGTLRLHQALLALRRQEPALQAASAGRVHTQVLDDGTLALVREGGATFVVVVVRLSGAGSVDLGDLDGVGAPSLPAPWRVLLSSESPAFTSAPAGLQVDLAGVAPRLHFSGPGAVILARRQDSEAARAR